jgi:hypothetical protein
MHQPQMQAKHPPGAAFLIQPNQPASPSHKSKQEVENSLPHRVSRDLGLGGIDDIPVNRSASSIDVDLGRSEPARALPRIAASPEEEHNGEREVRLEEILGSTDFAIIAEWVERSVELFLLNLE